jgi:hypothetical protein
MTPEQIKSVQKSFSNFPTVLEKFNEIAVNAKKPVQKSTPSFFPSITSNSPLDREKYLCYIAGLAGIENVEPVLSNNIDFGYDRMVPDFLSLTGVGDPRFSLGEMLSTVYGEFQLRTDLYLELQRDGGCQIIENYICDSDGNPIRELTYSCANLLNINLDTSLSANNNIPFINIPPIEATEVIEFVASKYGEAIQKDADRFISRIQNFYINQGWEIFLYTFEKLPFFYIKAVKDEEDILLNRRTKTLKYFRYHYDQKEYVSRGLNRQIRVLANGEFDEDDPKGLRLYEIAQSTIEKY